MKINNINVGFLGQDNFNFDGVEKLCKFYSIHPIKEITETASHHVLLIDVSESMRGYIDELKKGLKEVLKYLKGEKNNYISVVLYSGDNSSIIINSVKCEDISYRVSKVYKTIDTEVYVRGTTDLLAGMKSAVELLNDLDDEDYKKSILIFTDGYVAGAENFNTQRDKCLKLSRKFKEQKISVNTVGFGSYYDRNFLRDLSSVSYNGKFTHIADIKSFGKVVASKLKIINSKVDISFKIDNKEYFIFNTLEKLEGSNVISSVEKNSENIIAVFEENLNIDNTCVKPTRKKLSKEIVETFSYTLARYYIKNDDIKNMEKAILISGDGYVYDAILNCYSFTEKGHAIEILDEMIQDKSKRFRFGKRKINKDEEEICLLELLQEIMNDDECELLWNYSYKYKRIGVKEKNIEDEYKFIRPKIGFGKVKSISIGNEKLNIGVKVRIDGVVQNELNKLKLDACIYRDYNLVINGDINTDEVCCILSKAAKSKLRKAKLIKSVIRVYDDEVCVINLKNMKIVNKRVSNILDSKTVAKYLYDIEVLNCDIEVLERFLNEVFTEKDKIDKSEVELEIEKVRDIFRVDEGNIYKPLKVEKVSNPEYEFYISKIVEWKIDKFSKTKQMNSSLEKLRPLIIGDIKEGHKRVLVKLDELKKEKKYKQNLVNIVKMASWLEEKNIFVWDSVVTKNKSKVDRELKANMVVGSKVNISTKNVDGIKIREDYYELIRKFN